MSNIVKLNNVRLAFPNLFEPRAAQPGQTPKFSAAFLFAPEHPAVQEIKATMTRVAKERWGEKAETIYGQIKAGNKLCLHDGAEKSQYAGYEGNLFVNASNELKPPVVDQRRQPLTIADGKPYAGCYVNAIIDIWAQDNQHGKRINASLMGVQFYADGERLAGGGVASEQDFDEIPEAEGAAEDGAGAASVFD